MHTARIEDHELAALSTDDCDHIVADLGQGSGGRVGDCGADTSPDHYRGAVLVDLGRHAEGPDQVVDGVAGFEEVEGAGGPTPWTMTAIQPALGSAAAMVSGIRSPLPVTRTMRNWPARHLLATLGASIRKYFTYGARKRVCRMRFIGMTSR